MSDDMKTINIAPRICDAEHEARMASIARALEQARNAVCDAALDWYREPKAAAGDLRLAIEDWHTASEAFIHAVRGVR
jgi:hypothetical protein